MRISPGGKYTFHFSVHSNFFSVGMGLEPIYLHIGADITDAGFPVVFAWDGASQHLNAGGDGTVDLSFTYNGAETTDTDLGNAMQDAVNAVDSYGLNYESADAGNTTTGIVNEAGQVADKALPDASTVGLWAVALVLLAIGVYSFAGHAAERI